MKNFSIQTILLVSLSFLAKGQTGILSLEEAITIGLKNNYSIQIAGNDSKIATNNNTLGNAGFLPSLNISSFSTGSMRQLVLHRKRCRLSQNSWRN